MSCRSGEPSDDGGQSLTGAGDIAFPETLTTACVSGNMIGMPGPAPENNAATNRVRQHRATSGMIRVEVEVPTREDAFAVRRFAQARRRARHRAPAPATDVPPAPTAATRDDWPPSWRTWMPRGRRSCCCSGRRSPRRPSRTCWHAADAWRSTSPTLWRNAAGTWRFATMMTVSDGGHEGDDRWCARVPGRHPAYRQLPLDRGPRWLARCPSPRFRRCRPVGPAVQRLRSRLARRGRPAEANPTTGTAGSDGGVLGRRRACGSRFGNPSRP